jgi:hypothetical protein
MRPRAFQPWSLKISRLEGWNSEQLEDEWLFAKFREQNVGVMSAPEAFGAIDETVDLLLREQGESTATEILQTIIALALRSQTTEMPKSLLENRSEIQVKFSKFEDYAKNKLLELYQYCRIPKD